MTQLCRKLGPDLGTQMLTSATGQSPPVAFTMPSCKNRTCDSACATLIWFCSLRRMHLTKMTQLCRKLVPDLGTQSWPSQTDIIHWRHSPCRHAKTIHATRPVQLLYDSTLCEGWILPKWHSSAENWDRDLGTQSWPSQTDIIHWRHFTMPSCIAGTINATRHVHLL